MSSKSTAPFETWFRSHGGHFATSIHVAQDAAAGWHCKARDPVGPETTIVSAPHSLSLSYLNAIVDDSYPMFKQQRNRFKIEAMAFFYLMLQYLDRGKSFWEPYLEALPSPDEESTHPLFFEDVRDVTWLKGTDVWASATARKDVYKKYYHDGITALREAEMDVEPLTWHLFLWATTIFTSRSFSSRALAPHDSKYWTAYKTGPSGRRQAVLLDISHAPAEDLDFPVLFPGLDILNHSNEARVDWAFDPGRFSITSNDPIGSGDEVFNNYGPKANDELFLGYGFCIPDNPHDAVALTLKPPLQDLQQHLKKVQPGYFERDGSWSAKQTTARLKFPTTTSHDEQSQIFYHLPEPLLELLYYILRHERGLEFAFLETSIRYIASNISEYPEESRYLPHIARLLVSALAPKLATLQTTQPSPAPRSKRQEFASMYRQGQVKVLESLITALRTYTRSLIPPSPSTSMPSSGPALLTLESALPALLSPHHQDAFLQGIEANANTRDLTQLRLAGWEEDVWVLLLCYQHILPPDEKNGRIVVPPSRTSELTEVEIVQGGDLLELVRTAASSGEEIWAAEQWDPGFIAGTGGRIVKEESFMISTNDDDDDGGEARLHVLIVFE